MDTYICKAAQVFVMYNEGKRLTPFTGHKYGGTKSWGVFSQTPSCLDNVHAHVQTAVKVGTLYMYLCV